MSRPLAARSEATASGLTTSCPKGSKYLRKHLSVRVVTIYPVSIKQWIETPPNETLRCGHADTNCGAGSIKFEMEPIGSPTEQWLCSSVGASFPTAEPRVGLLPWLLVQPGGRIQRGGNPLSLAVSSEMAHALTTPTNHWVPTTNRILKLGALHPSETLH